MKRSLSIILALVFALSATAQKELKALRGYVKANNATEALKEAARLEKDSTFALAAADKAGLLPTLYDLTLQANLITERQQNEKMYLKQQADTTALFQSIYGIFQSARRCHEAEVRERFQLAAAYAKEGKTAKADKTRSRYERPQSIILCQRFPNLLTGARYFFARQKWAEAEQLANIATLTASDTAYWAAKPMLPQVSEADLSQMAYISLASAYKQQHYADAMAQAEAALRDTTAHADVLEYLATSAAQLGDTTQYVNFLLEGMIDYPDDSRFFLQLYRHHYRHSQFDEALQLAERQLQHRDSTLYREARMIALYQLKRYDDVLADATTILQKDSTSHVSYYYTGAAYCQKARAVQLPTNRNSRSYRQLLRQRKDFYQQAREPMETYRRLQPERVGYWKPFLYDIYLALNMGKEFEEIQNL